MNTNPKSPEAEPADLPDDIEIEAGANYDGFVDLGKPINPKPGFHYTAAAADGDTSRPDGVAMLKLRGYEVCTEETCLSPDCVLMRIPQRIWDARQARKNAANARAFNADTPIKDLPKEQAWQAAEHGKVRKAK